MTTMPTELLYHQDDYLETFDAAVLEIDREDGTLVLDKTAFFPTGGHQHCDQGRIDKDRRSGLIVTGASKEDGGRVRHSFEAERGTLEPGDRVTGTIDWGRRYYHMRLHTAQHIFSRFATERLGAETGRASFSPAGGKIVMTEPMSWEQILVLEDDVNRMIGEARPVVRTIDDDGIITISIEGHDQNHCGGTHIRSTDEIGLFKITAVDGKNLLYEIGDRALRSTIRLANNALQAAGRLEISDPRQLAAHVLELDSELTAARKTAALWEERLTEARLDLARRSAIRLGDDASLLPLDAAHLSAKTLKDLLKKDLREGGEGQVWICLAARRNLLISSATTALDAGELLERLVEAWGMRGAGAGGFAQGGPVPEDIDDPLTAVVQIALTGAESD